MSLSRFPIIHFSFEFDSLNMHSTVASVRTIRSRTTVASAPTFRSNERAEKRKEVLPLLVLIMWGLFHGFYE